MIHTRKFDICCNFIMKKGENVGQAHREICEMYGKEALSKYTARNWYRRFKEGIFHVAFVHRSVLTSILCDCGRRVVYLHDHNRPYISVRTQQKLRDFGWIVLIHPANSPDLTATDYHRFQHLQHSLYGVKLTAKEDCKNHIYQFFLPKSTRTLHQRDYGIRWKKIADQNGKYVI